MLKIVGNDIMRNGEKIGWLENSHVFGREGEKLGRFDDKYVYGRDDEKQAYIEGDYLCPDKRNFPKIFLENLEKDVEGGFPVIAKAAAYLLLGE